MQRFATTCAAGLLAAGLLMNATGCTGGPESAQAQNSAEAGVTLRPVDFAGFEQTLAESRGRVVVVDYWQDTCTVCKKEFPHVVQMHNKYARDGLVVVSLNLDDPAEEEMRKRALHFLESQKATMVNLALAPKQDPEDWFKKLKLDDGLPATSVYDRGGKLVKQFSGGGNHETLEKLVADLLKQK